MRPTVKEINGSLQGLLDAAAKAQAMTPIVLAGVDLYRKIREHLGAPPDSLTDAQLAAALRTRGFALKVSNDSWLKAHGF